MTFTTMMAITIGAGLTVQAGSISKQRLTVYVSNSANVSDDVTVQAENLAASMFGSIGVQVDWRRGEPRSSSGQALAIQLAAKTPKDEMPGALAYAKPHEGVHIVVFWDRIQFGPAPARLLAHVMVHEITHILEGTCRHSETGIMKAQWTDEDRRAMQIQPLRFAPVDVDLILRGLAARDSNSALELTANRTVVTAAPKQ
jgi:hypothetical protein